MGCVSSKIMTKSASFREEFNRSMRKINSSTKEITISNDGGEKFIALLLKEVPLSQEPNVIKNPNPNSINTEDPEMTGIETINTWELLSGLEEDNEARDDHEVVEKSIISNDPTVPSRSFPTEEDFDALIEAEKHEKGLKRKAMAKDLRALTVNPEAFEFTRDSSLKDWLLHGGLVFSPGTYVTPQFGNSVDENGDKNGDAGIVFDPELVEQFENALEELTIEEEGIIKEIIERLEGNEELQKEMILFLLRKFCN